MILYLLGLLGAGLGALGDVCGTQSVRSTSRWAWLYDLVGVVAWMLCYPVWRYMSARCGGGFAQPAAAWTIAGAFLAVLIAACYREQESALSKALFVVIILAGGLRALVK